MRGLGFHIRILGLLGLVCIAGVAIWLWIGNWQMRQEIRQLRRQIDQLDRSAEEARRLPPLHPDSLKSVSERIRETRISDLPSPTDQSDPEASRDLRPLSKP